MNSHAILIGDASATLVTLPAASVHLCVTSPPYYGLRDYGADGQIGLEPTPGAYVAALVAVFREVRRVLRDDGSLWLNLGDSYADKALLGMPWRVAFALMDDGWILRQDVIWHKPSPMPEPVRDRCTRAHEYMFHFTKKPVYFFDSYNNQEPAEYADSGLDSKARGDFNGKTRANPGREAFRAIRETRNRRSVWTVATQPFKGAHFAPFPPKLIEPCILTGTSDGGACAACGAPMIRETKRTPITRERPNDFVKRDGEGGTGNSCGNTVAGVRVEHAGWSAPCSCGAGVEPCVVLDPFTGSGTTGAVAVANFRRFVGIELNPVYAAMAEKRIREATPNPRLEYQL